VAWACPECSAVSPTRDHAAERSWRHLDSCQFETYIHARIPRVACTEHGVRQIHIPWAEPDSRFTKQFERLAVGILAECRVSGTAAVLGLSWDEAQGMQERAARRREARRNARLSETRNGNDGISQFETGETSESSSNGLPRHGRTRSTNGNGTNPSRQGQGGNKAASSGHNQCQPHIPREKLHRHTS